MRNPLSSIGLNGELLEEELQRLGSKEASRLLAAIQGEVQRLESITEEYLRYARMPTPDRERIDLRDLLQSFVRFVEPEMVEARITLNLSLGEAQEAEAIHGDRDQIRQALLNVARNAREALRDEPEPRSLHIALRFQEPQSLAVIFEDNGPGLSPSVASQIFDPFVTTKEGGTGLGLPLCRQILDAHGGSVTAHSREDGHRGARFVLTFPGIA